jgi:hypothetical protein
MLKVVSHWSPWMKILDFGVKYLWINVSENCVGQQPELSWNRSINCMRRSNRLPNQHLRLREPPFLIRLRLRQRSISIVLSKRLKILSSSFNSAKRTEFAIELTT